MAAWSAKVSTSAICLSVNGLTSRRINRYDAEQGIAFKDGHGKHGAERLDIFRAIGIVGVGLDIGNVDSSAFERGTGRAAIRYRGELDVAQSTPLVAERRCRTMPFAASRRRNGRLTRAQLRIA